MNTIFIPVNLFVLWSMTSAELDQIKTHTQVKNEDNDDLYQVFTFSICHQTAYAKYRCKFVISDLNIKIDIKYRFASAEYAMTVFNPTNDNKTYVADIPFPDKALISNVSLEINGEVYIGQVIEKDNNGSRKTERPKNWNLLQQTNSFVMPVLIPAQTSARLIVRYHEILQRTKEAYMIKGLVGHCRNVYNLLVEIAITELRPLTELKVMPAKWSETAVLEKNLTVSRPSNNTAKVVYKILSNENNCLDQIEVIYDVERNSNAGDIIVEDGFFVHFLAPTGLKAIPKDVIFVLDTSSSMTGLPMKELQKAMITILDKLNPHDRFNIIEFQTTFGLFESELQNVSDVSIEAAKNMIQHLSPGGASNIHDALLASVKMLHKARGGAIRSPIIIFLTDGQASVGVRNSETIEKRVKFRNTRGIPIFSISLGHEADQALTSKISTQNFGYARHILDVSTTSTVFSEVYEEVAVTLLKNLEILYTNNAVNNKTLTQTQFRTLFNNTEITVSGKLQNSSSSLNAAVFGLGANGFNFLSDPTVSILPSDPHLNTIKHIWQYKRINEVMMLKSSISDPDVLRKLDATLTRLSLQYNYITPVTTVLLGSGFVEEKPSLVKINEKAYAAATLPGRKRRRPFSGKGDPHFQVGIPDLEYPICFDINMKPGSILQILKVPGKLIVNIGIIPEGFGNRGDKMYISDIFIRTVNDTVLLNINSSFFYNGDFYRWPSDNCSMESIKRLSTCVLDDKNLIEINASDSVRLRVRRVLHESRKYFNIYFSDIMSTTTASGLIANIVRSDIRLTNIVNQGTNIVGRFKTRSTLRKKREYLTGKLKTGKETRSNLCWHVHKNLDHFIGTDYILKSLFHSDDL